VPSPLDRTSHPTGRVCNQKLLDRLRRQRALDEQRRPRDRQGEALLSEDGHEVAGELASCSVEICTVACSPPQRPQARWNPR
jgi:hypothetical protein